MEYLVGDRGAGDGDGSPFSIPQPSVSVLAHDPLLTETLQTLLGQNGFETIEPKPPASTSIGFSTHVSVCIPPMSTRAFADGAWRDRMVERADRAALIVLARAHLPVFDLVDVVEPTRGVIVLDGDGPDALERLGTMIWLAAAGQRFVDPSFAPSDSGVDVGLSPAEQRVYDLLAVGASNRGIADTLFVSERTVEVHVRRVFAKLGLKNDSAVNRRVLAALRYSEASGGR